MSLPPPPVRKPLGARMTMSPPCRCFINPPSLAHSTPHSLLALERVRLVWLQLQRAPVGFAGLGAISRVLIARRQPQSGWPIRRIDHRRLLEPLDRARVSASQQIVEPQLAQGDSGVLARA